jgi:hypothetical protein
MLLSLGAQAGANTMQAPLLSVQEVQSAADQSFFIRPTTNFARSYVVLNTKLDGALTELEQPIQDLWVFNTAGLVQGSQHTLTFTIFLADAKQYDKISASLFAVGEEIERLQTEIADTTDPEELEGLNLQLAQQRSLQRRLKADLANLNNFIGTQNFLFQANSF